MNTWVVAELLFIGLAFAAWPVALNKSGVVGAWPAIIVVMATALSQTLCSLRGLSQFPPASWLLLFILAGAINGVAVYRYARLAASSVIPVGVLVTLVSALMIVFGVLLDWAFKGVAPTGRQVGGYGAAILAVYLLAGPK